MEKENKVYTFSADASKLYGYSIINLKDGTQQYYTAVYDSVEKVESDYKWKDKYILDIKQEDISYIDYRLKEKEDLRKYGYIEKLKPFPTKDEAFPPFVKYHHAEENIITKNPEGIKFVNISDLNNEQFQQHLDNNTGEKVVFVGNTKDLPPVSAENKIENILGNFRACLIDDDITKINNFKKKP